MNTIKNYYIDGLKKVTKNLDYTAQEVQAVNFSDITRNQMITENKEFYCMLLTVCKKY